MQIPIEYLAAIITSFAAVLAAIGGIISGIKSSKTNKSLTQNNGGSSTKDAFDRIEVVLTSMHRDITGVHEDVRGLYGRVRTIESSAHCLRCDYPEPAIVKNKECNGSTC